MSKQKKWQRFENLVAQIQRTLTPESVVKQNDKIRGRHSKKPRQIDISIRHKIGQYEILIVMDCKDYKEPIDVKGVEEFMGLVDDVGANKSAMVSAIGFSKTAKDRAKDAGIDLYRLIDAEKHEWQTYVTIPVLCDMRLLKEFDLKFNPKVRIEPSVLFLCKQDGTPTGFMLKLLTDKWNKGLFPKEPGQYEALTLTDEETYVNENGHIHQIDIKINIRIERHLYYGQLPLKEIKGFLNQITGEIITSGFTTEWLDINYVISHWKEVKTENELAVTPLLVLPARNNLTTELKGRMIRNES